MVLWDLSPLQILVKLKRYSIERHVHFFFNLISTMSTPLMISMMADSSDPVYGSVHTILQRNYIGSWADAGYAYTKIRRDLLWADIRALLSLKPTEGNKGKMAPLLQELKHVSADLRDTDASSLTSFLTAEALVAAWSVPPVKAAKASGPKNAFAALLEDSDEE
jgi:hypothetical protein